MPLLPSRLVRFSNFFINPLKTLPHCILEGSIFDVRNVRLYDVDIPKEKWLNYLQTEDPDKTLCSAASDLGLHCLPVTSLGVSSDTGLQLGKACYP